MISMKAHWKKAALSVVSVAALTACAIAPQQAIGYRMTSEVLPTYVNGQYVGMQSGSYVAPEQVVTTTTYVQPPTTVVYRQTATPITIYSPPVYVNPWPWYGIGVGTGLGIGVGINYYSGCCRWNGGHRGWHHHHRHHQPRGGPPRWRR
jgi:hypothetical protein